MPQRLFATGQRAVATACVLGALMIGSFTLAAWSFSNGHTQACHARDATLNVLSAILIDARAQTDNDPTIDPDQRAKSDRFVYHELTKINAARC